MHSWEEALVKQVAKRRGEEADHLARFQYLQAVSVSVNMAWPVVALVATLLTYGWVHDAPPPMSDLFAVLALFKMIQSPFRAFSDGLASVAQASVSINRMRDIILKPMLAPQERVPAAKAGEIAVSCEGEFRWDPDGRALLRLTRPFTARAGDLIGVCGPVGSGKSSLCSAILGEMQGPTSTLHGSVAYVAQSAFILNGSVRENILFGSRRPFSREDYDRAVQASALQQDLEILVSGDETEIGAKGTNLSGGQKQRISLARACYSNADVVIMDDPLAAVDSHVGRHIWDAAITGCLRDATRILVTNQLHLLGEEGVSRIVVLEKGRVCQEGSHSELMGQEGGQFRQLVASMAQAEASPRAKSDEDDEKQEHKDDAAKKDGDTKGGAKKGGGVGKGKEGAGKLVKAEERHKGAVKLRRYLGYYALMKRRWFTCTLLLLYPMTEACGIVQDWWLGQWSLGTFGAGDSCRPTSRSPCASRS